MYQLNPLLEFHVGKVVTIATPLVKTAADTATGAGIGYAASKFGTKGLSDEEKKERTKKFTKRGAAVGFGVGTVGSALPYLNKNARSIKKAMWNSKALKYNGKNDKKILATLNKYSDRIKDLPWWARG